MQTAPGEHTIFCRTRIEKTSVLNDELLEVPGCAKRKLIYARHCLSLARSNAVAQALHRVVDGTSRSGEQKLVE